MKARKNKFAFSACQLLLGVFFLVAVILPLLQMLLNMTSVDVGGLLLSDRFKKALINSLAISITATLISVIFAAVLSWCIARTGIKKKSLWSVLFTLPMLIPSISHGMGLIVLFGSNGILTRFFNIQGDIYGYWGIVIGSVIYSFPVAFLMLHDVLKYEDSSAYEAANVLGLTKFRQFTAITLPYLRKPLIAVFFSVFTLITTDYGVPLMLGTNQSLTLPVMMYKDVIEGMNFGNGSVIGLVLLIPALIAFIIDFLNKDGGNMSFVTRPFSKKRNRARDIFAYVFCCVAVILLLLPIGSFVLLTFAEKYPMDLSFTMKHILRSFEMKAGTYLLNSLLISVMVSVVGVVISLVVSYLTARVKSKASRLLHLVSIASLAIPGLVLGLSYVLFFKGTSIYNTILILIMVNLVHFFASPYLMMYNTFGKLNSNLEVVGATLGVSRIRIIFDVLIPQARATIIEMSAYFFVNSMMTISAISFLATAETKPLSLMLPSLENTMMRESMAFISLLILVVNLIMRSSANLLKKKTALR